MGFVFKTGCAKRRDRKCRSTANIRLSRRAATCVEFAMVAPFVLAIGFGSIEFSRVVMVKQSLTNASREGCRLATLATSISSDDVDAAVRGFLRRSIRQVDDPETVVVTISPSDLSTVQTGDEINVLINVQFADVSWFQSRWSGSANLTGNATMIRE
jgi:hypothetical protein